MRNTTKVHLLTYALNEKGDLVHVDEVKTGLECDCSCPACNESLIAKNKGEKRTHHFAHQSGTECKYGYESMLHLLAKCKIQQAFLTSNIFLLEYDYKSHCPNENTCHYVKYERCFTVTRKRFDLKQYYDRCEQEVSYDNIRRRSDLKLYSSIFPNREPVYIEFCVTHASEQSKLHSGAKIIECIIENEEDIEYIQKNGFILGHEQYSRYEEFRKDIGIQIYSFKDYDYNNTEIHCEIEFSRYVLYQSGKTRCFQDYCDCKNIAKSSRYSICEICFHTPCAFGIYDIAKYLGYAKHPIANCMLCKNYVESYNGTGKICRLYKFLQLPQDKNHDTSRAKTCPRYMFNQEEYEQVLNGQSHTPPYDELKDLL